MELKYKKKFLINTTYYVVLALLLTVVFKFSFTYLLPLVFGFLIAFLVQNTSEKIAKFFRLPQSVCSIFLVIISYVLVAFLLWFFICFLLKFLKSFSNDLTGLAVKFEVFIDEISKKTAQIFNKISPEITDYFNRFSKDFFSELSNNIAKSLTGITADWVSKIPLLFLNTIVSLVAGCYIAKDYNNWKKFLKGLCSENILIKCKKIKRILSENVLALLKGYSKLYFITFILLLVGFFILGIRQAFYLAFLISFIDLLPILGTGTVLIPWSIFSFLDHNYFLGVGIAMLYLIVVLVRNFSEPKVVSKQFGINPLITLIFMFVGLRLFGIIGIILLPITMITIIKYYKEM